MLSKKEDASIGSVQLEDLIEDDTAIIYVWSSGFNSLGHVSIKFKDDYGSIWPKSTPAGGLTSIWPLKATLATKLEDDCMQEAIRPKEEFANLMEPVEILPVKPDKVFVVRGLDTQKMRNELTRIKEGFDTGEVCYQLLPGVKTSGFLHSILSGNPKNTEVYNCVTLTGHLLAAGGKSLINDPWATPSNFAEKLDNLDQVKLLNPPATDTEKPRIQEDAPKAESAATSIRNRLTSRWFSDDYFDADTNSQEATDTRSETQESVSRMEDTPSPKVSETSFSFFDNENNGSSFLQRRDEESDSRYIQRIDSMSN
ncbi:Uncharacterised protein [Legionella steigerwaltii]|uniref:Uncharacterized protein n=1 Tax=Legionella steigerwaltii TaxID=460 RepID=A0A378LCF5_9GAMM|nr:hypothetical protein [Legionella steigerwaltii]KTD70296.1 hypothetical protein Lstg_3298 [Legionella steigerwaltii]STY24030.1 Uncharacterised protein [Legionella steigerwaltii]